MAESQDAAGESRTGSGFPPTHWSTVLHAAHAGSPEADGALTRLCETYWYPLYAFVRRQGHAPQDAQDLTQAFFEHLLSRDFLSNVTPDKGRFRSFLLTCLKRYLADEWRKGHACKRGAGRPVLVLDEKTAENLYQREPDHSADALELYERRWALALLDRVLERLGTEFAAAGKQATFGRLQSFLLGERGGGTYTEAAASLGTTEGAVKMTVLRMRERYRALFREEIAHTVAEPGEIAEEVRHVVTVLRQ